MTRATAKDIGPAKTEQDSGRERLMTEALRIFARDGFAGASTREIAEAAGVNHSLIPYHFGSKDGLWRETMSALLDLFRAAQEAADAAHAGAPPVDKLRASIRAFVAFCAARPEFHRVMTAEWASKSERIKWLGETYVKPLSRRMIALIQEGQRQGLVTAGDPVRLHYAMIGTATTAFVMADEYKMLCGRDPRTQAGIEDTVSIIERMLIRP
jgi:TetR/AcrR family transcriptional regulator